MNADRLREQWARRSVGVVHLGDRGRKIYLRGPQVEGIVAMRVNEPEVAAPLAGVAIRTGVHQDRLHPRREERGRFHRQAGIRRRRGG